MLRLLGEALSANLLKELNGKDLRMEAIFHVIIPGRAGIKKNSKQIVYSKSAKRPFLVSSSKFKAWENFATPFVKFAAAKMEPIDFPVNVAIKIYLKNHQNEPDLTNAMEGPLDLLQNCGVLKNDKLVYSLHRCEKIFGDPTERIEITISRHIF